MKLAGRGGEIAEGGVVRGYAGRPFHVAHRQAVALEKQAGDTDRRVGGTEAFPDSGLIEASI